MWFEEADSSYRLSRLTTEGTQLTTRPVPERPTYRSPEPDIEGLFNLNKVSSGIYLHSDGHKFIYFSSLPGENTFTIVL